MNESTVKREYLVELATLKRAAGMSVDKKELKKIVSIEKKKKCFWAELILTYFKEYKIIIPNDIKKEINALAIKKHRNIVRMSAPRLFLDYRQIVKTHNKPRFSKRMRLIEEIYYPVGIEPRLFACCHQLLLDKIENNTNCNYYELVKDLVGKENFELYKKNKIKTALAEYFFTERTELGYSQKLLSLFNSIRKAELYQIIDQRLTIGQEDILVDEMICTIARTLFKKFYKKFNLVSDGDVELINEILIQLDPKSLNIIYSFFGITGYAMSLQELSDSAGKTKERIGQIKNHGMLILKHADQMKILREKFKV